MNVLAITIQEIFNNATIITMSQLELMEILSVKSEHHKVGCNLADTIA